MELITLKEAKDQGLKHYFTGKPCRNGHVCRRFVKRRQCMKCCAIKHKKYVDSLPENRKNELLRQQRKSRGKWYDKLTVDEKEQEKIRVRVANRKVRRGKSPEELWQREAFYDARRRAKKKNLEFSVGKSDLVIPEYCPVLRIPIYCNRKNGSSYQSDNSPSVDRIDNNKGYTKDNIAIISWRANSIKGNANLEELKMLVKWLEEQQN